MNNPDEIIQPTPERLAKAGDATGEHVTESGRRTVRMLDGSQVSMLFERGSLNADQFNAGERFYADWYFAGLAASGVIDPARDVVDGGKIETMTERRLAALGRWQSAVQGVGKMHSQALTCIVLLDEPLEVYGRRYHKRASRKDATIAAITVLQVALAQLDLYYYGERSTRTGASHAPDYRPSIEPT